MDRKMASNKSLLLLGIILVFTLLIVATYFFIKMLQESLSNMETAVDFGGGSINEVDEKTNDSFLVKQCLSSKGYKGLIFIYSNGCLHCRRMMPIIDALNQKGYNITKISVGDSKQINEIMGCVKLHSYVPQYLCANNGDIELGEMSEEEIIDLYNKCVSY